MVHTMRLPTVGNDNFVTLRGNRDRKNRWEFELTVTWHLTWRIIIAMMRSSPPIGIVSTRFTIILLIYFIDLS